MQNNPKNGGSYELPKNPILQTARLVGALVWFCGEDREGSTHCTGKVLEWVAGTPLDNSPENLEAREELSGQIMQLAFKVARPPFDDYESAIRLVECAIPIHNARDKTAFMEDVRAQLYQVRNSPVRQTVVKVKALLDADHNNPAQDVNQVLEWVRQTPLNDSLEQLEAREMLVERIKGLALKLAAAPFEDSAAALRLLDCTLGIQVSQQTRKMLEVIRGDMQQKIQ